MEFLWKKENADEDAFYRDLFANLEKDFPEHIFYDLSSMTADVVEKENAKINAFSDHHRKGGNEKFKEGKWEEALKLYNEMLCFAENDSENVALAYGNRSACNFKLKMYGKCLTDIELAINAKYPERLKWKLENRKTECLKLLHSDLPTKKSDVKLSYKADSNFPFMANILEIRRNVEYGRHVITKCDIPAGKTVLIEDNFISFTKANNMYTKNDGPKKCITCNKIAMNPIPCLKCVVVMFCNTECRSENKVHKMDCGAIYYLDDKINNKYIIQSILVAVNMFPTVECLMDFIKDVVTSEKFEIPKSVLDQHSKYRMFLKLWTPSKRENFVSDVYKFYRTILRFEEIRKLFNSTLKQRFLMHLLGHHAAVLLSNSAQGQICVFTSLFSHSCIPNIQEIWMDNRTACITIRPVKKGEQLCLSYMSEEMGKILKKDHRIELYKEFGFQCKCLKCVDELADLKKIERDQCFVQLNNIEIINPKNKDLRDFNEKSVKLLNKYKHLPWSYQLDHISKRLGYSLGLFYHE